MKPDSAQRNRRSPSEIAHKSSIQDAADALRQVKREQKRFVLPGGAARGVTMGPHHHQIMNMNASQSPSTTDAELWWKT